jgi:hypothetical protein
MAAVTPVSANHCKGKFADGTPDVQLYCLKGFDDQGDPIYTCAKWRKFRVSCPKLNQLCSNLSEAWVAAITVCNQHLY